MGVGPADTVFTSDGMVARWQEPAPSGIVHVSTTAPASPATGQLWYDTDATC